MSSSMGHNVPPEFRFLPHNYTRLRRKQRNKARNFSATREEASDANHRTRRKTFHCDRSRARHRDRNVRRPYGSFRAGRGIDGRSSHPQRSSSPRDSPKLRRARLRWAWEDISPRKPTPSTMRRELSANIARRSNSPEIETEEVAKVFRGYGISEAQMAPVVNAITPNQKRWVEFMMRFELGLEAAGPGARAAAAPARSPLRISLEGSCRWRLTS